MTKLKFSFYLYPNPENSEYWVMHFQTIRGYVPYGKATAGTPAWPWKSEWSDVYTEVQSDPERFGALMLRRTFDEKGEITGYFFDEPDGKYLITCYGM